MNSDFWDLVSNLAKLFKNHPCRPKSLSNKYDKMKRAVEVLDKETGEFKSIAFANLQKGMIFRMYEYHDYYDPNRPVLNQEGNFLFRATSDAYIHPYGEERKPVWTVDSEAY